MSDGDHNEVRITISGPVTQAEIEQIQAVVKHKPYVITVQQGANSWSWGWSDWRHLYGGAP